MNATNRDWAANELEIAPQSDAGTARAALLNHLEAEDMVPAESRIAAWNQWAVDALPLSREGRNELPAEPHPDFDEFLADYWKLEPVARQARWLELCERYPSGRIAAQLKHLKQGLRLSGTTKDANQRVRELAAILREIFLLQPRSATIRRHEWLATIADRKDWAPVVRILREGDLGLPLLDPPLIDWIMKFPASPVMVGGSRFDESEKIAWGSDFNSQSFAPIPKVRRLEPVVRQESTQDNAKNYLWVFALVIGVISAVFRISSSSNTSTPPSIPMPAYRSPDYVRPTFANPLYRTPDVVRPHHNRFSDIYNSEELISFFDYKPDSGQPEPPEYRTFMMNGGEEILEKMRGNPGAVVFMRAQVPIKIIPRPTRISPRP
jgi:hypothetical protein